MIELENKLPPQSQEAEQYLIGSCLRENTVIDDVVNILEVDDFYFDHHQKIYQAIIDKRQSGKPVDTVILFEELRNRKQIEDIGGAVYLGKLWDCCNSPSFASHYAKVIHEKATARRLIGICTEMIRDAYDGCPALDLVANFESKIFAINRAVNTELPIKISTLVQTVIEEIDDRSKPNPTIKRDLITTPLQSVNQCIGGMHNGNLIVLAARPGVGKTAFAMNLALHAASQKTGGIFFSLEMTPKQLAERALAYQGQIPLNVIRGNAAIEPSHAQRIVTAGSELNIPLWLDQRPYHTVDTIAATIRRAKRRHNIGVAFIDYLQLIEKQGRRNDTNDSMIGDITRKLKLLARSEHIPIILLSQLNRLASDAEPCLHHLRESGNIEQDADDVFFLYSKQGPQNAEANQPIWFKIGKQRNGPVPQPFEINYQRPYIRFDDGGL